jgi:ubiquitin-activating enzyme E1
MSKRLNESEVPLSAKKLKVSNREVVIEQKTMQLDEDLHSRQLAVYGRASMRRMAASDILICGLLGLGVETGIYIRNMALDPV